MASLKRKRNTKQEKKICSICCVKQCSVMHCKVCKGDDKLVCRSCIVNMLKLCDCENMCVLYQCPHCRKDGLMQCWFKDNVRVQRKHIELLKKRLRLGDFADNSDFEYDDEPYLEPPMNTPHYICRNQVNQQTEMITNPNTNVNYLWDRGDRQVALHEVVQGLPDFILLINRDDYQHINWRTEHGTHLNRLLKGHFGPGDLDFALEMFKHPDIDLTIEDSDGNTAVYLAEIRYPNKIQLIRDAINLI